MGFVDATEEIVEVAHDVLVGADHESADVVGLAFLERMEREGLADVLEVDEVVDLAVGVARDVDERRLDRRTFVEAMDRSDREELVEGPVVEQGLEDREVADVLFGQHRIEAGELIRDVGGVLEVIADLATDVPEETVGGGAFFEAEVAEAETGVGFFALFLRVMVALERVELPLVLADGFQLLDQLVGLALRGVDLAVVAGDAVDRFEDQDRVRGDEGSAGFRDDVGELHLALFADLLDVRDHVAGVDFHAVVHGRFVGRAATIVVDAEAAADVEETHREAHAFQLAVEAGRFYHGLLDRADVRDLGADVEVDEAKGVLHLRLGETAGDFDDLGGRQAELRVLASAVGPLAFAGRGELDAQADVGLHAHAAGDADDGVDLGELFDDDDGLLAEAAAHQGELDVFFVLVAVADQEGLAVLEQGKGDDELGLRAGFEAEIIFFAGVEDLLDHFAELVDLDREDAAVAAIVVFFLDGVTEGFVDLRHAIAEQVLDADRERGLQAGGFDFLDDVRDADLAVVTFRVHAEVTLRVHGEVVTSPSFEAVVFFGVFGSPGLRFAHVGREVDFFIVRGEAQGEISPPRTAYGSTRRGRAIVWPHVRRTRHPSDDRVTEGPGWPFLSHAGGFRLPAVGLCVGLARGLPASLCGFRPEEGPLPRHESRTVRHGPDRRAVRRDRRRP